MLGLKYVVAKSKELQVKLERTATGSSAATASPSGRYSARSARNDGSDNGDGAQRDLPPTATALDGTAATADRHRAVSSPTSGSRNEGELFLKLQQKQWEKALTKHDELLARCCAVLLSLSSLLSCCVR